MSADAAAVVVRWRGGDEAARCLRSLSEHARDHLAEVVLVDSGSGDGGAERLAAAFPSVRVLDLPVNRGFAHAANRGVAATDAPLVLLLNPDTLVRPGSVDTLTRFLTRRPAVAGVVPQLVGPDGAPQHRWQLRRLPDWVDLACGRGGRPAFAGPPTGPAPVPQPAASAWLVRRSVWEALDGLDESFAPAWWEDVDLCARLAGRLGEPGFPATRGFWVAPKAVVRHRGGSSVPALGTTAFLTVFHGNLLRYARRHHPGRQAEIAAGIRLTLALKSLARPHRGTAYRAALAALEPEMSDSAVRLE